MMFRQMAITFLLCLLVVPSVFADVGGTVRDRGVQYARPLEAIMVDGPLYAGGHAYYVAEYVKPDSTVAASLIYDPSISSFISEPETIRKVLATKDLKKLTVADPLFFALGDPQLLIKASKYETQNVRNFASFASITPEEKNILEIFLKDYESVMERVANTSALTQKILYPDNALEINYLLSPPSMDIKLEKGFTGGRFSYEGFESLISAYESLNHEYRKLSSDLSAFAGGLPEYQPGAIIREKWEIQITKEGLLEEVALIEDNGEQIKKDMELRKEILSHPYDAQIKEAGKRLGVNPEPKSAGIASRFAGVIARLKNAILGLFGLGGLIFFFRERRPPNKRLFSFLILYAVLGALLLPLSYSANGEGIPTMDEIISQKVRDNETVPYTNLAAGLDDPSLEELLFGFRLMYSGETVEVRGPYDYYGKPYYFFDVKKDGASTGNGFLVDAENNRLVGDQRQAYQLLKTLLFSDLLKEKPLYIGEDPLHIATQATATLESPLDLFLTNLSLNVKDGIALEKRLIENPDFEALLDLTEHYIEGFVLIQNINHLVSLDESEKLTGGFSRKLYSLDAYSRATRGLSTQEYLQGRMAQYRGRTLNRLPLIAQLAGMGLTPSKAQVAHDLTSDLVHDNTYLWRKGSITNPNLFARLSFREGTFTEPQSAAAYAVNISE